MLPHLRFGWRRVGEAALGPRGLARCPVGRLLEFRERASTRPVRARRHKRAPQGRSPLNVAVQAPETRKEQ
eukprot:9407194-Pyramimonas_sp.AAC.1